MHDSKLLIVVDVIVTCFTWVTPVAQWIRPRSWGGVMGMRKTMKRKHMETKGLGGGRCGRDRMFYISSSIYRGHTPCG